MRLGPIAILLLSLTLTPPALATQEKPAAQVVAEDAAEADLERLDQAHEAAKAAYAKTTAENRARRAKDPEAALVPAVYPDAEYALRFREASTRHPGTAASTAMLIRAFELSYRDRRADAAAKDILDELLEGHMRSDRLTWIASELILGTFYLGEDTTRAAMTRIIDESPHDGVKAAFLHARATLVRNRPDHSAEERAVAIADLDRAIELGAGTRYGDAAKAVKFELEHLQVGQPAPEIEGVDLDGVAFKLSDYRGKVVVLDFWGDW